MEERIEERIHNRLCGATVNEKDRKDAPSTRCHLSFFSSPVLTHCLSEKKRETRRKHFPGRDHRPFDAPLQRWLMF